jgi:hypothetical protein
MVAFWGSCKAWWISMGEQYLKNHFRCWLLKQVLIWVFFCKLLVEIDLIQVFFCELLTEIILVTVFLYTGPMSTEKESYNAIYGTQSYYCYVVLYPTYITYFWAMIILSCIKCICKVIYCRQQYITLHMRLFSYLVIVTVK